MASESEAMRAEFEAWIFTSFPDAESCLMRRGDGYYWTPVHDRWLGWCERGRSWTTGEPMTPPRTLLLACAAIEQSVEPIA